VAPSRFIAIHGHFYQPPRENPWLEAVEVQDSAAPYHDWNERVTAECYAPNTAARRVDPDNRVLDIVNNFEKISFNVGPTLMAWLERRAPDVYTRILEADRASVAARGGHGNAIAQVYNHMILPLASRRDKVTQVRWGLADFRHRFGREPEGMWLPETAVDTESLEVLAEAGLAFTILAPGQARRLRPLAAEGDPEPPWEEVGGGIDPTRAYLWRGPRGHRLALFFYDGPISRGIAFEHLLERGEHLVDRLRRAFGDGRPWAQLVHVATDGESYGHHRRFGEMALAAAVQQAEAAGFAALTSYGAFLAAQPPTHEVEIHEASSWSCAHGVERWRADCGCRFDPATHQRWRAPLREALDWLRDQADAVFEARGAALLRDPWAARDAYAAVVLDRSPATLEAFLAAHQRAPLDEAGRLEARRLLELQRHRMLMYTSCGWFFDDLAGLEPVQVLRYAAMVLQYLRDVAGSILEPEFVRRLAAAPTNGRDMRDGAEVYRRLIKPAAVDVRRVVAHYAIRGILEDYPDDCRVHAYRVQRLDEAREAYGGTALRIAHVAVTAEMTGERREAMYAVLHFGGHDFSCGIRAWEDGPTYDAMKADLLERFSRYTLADMVRGMDLYFPGEASGLTHLFLDERRRALALILRGVLDRHEQTYHRLWDENRKLVWYLRQADAPIPEALAIVARHVLEEDVREALAGLDPGVGLPPRVGEIVNEARLLGLTLDLAGARPHVQDAVGRALDAVAAAPAPDRVAAAVSLVAGARELKLPFGFWAAQNRFFEIWRTHPDARRVLKPLAEAFGFNLAVDSP
jgi:alpha-amylase/alpha-mannosidase (GH57 family)